MSLVIFSVCILCHLVLHRISSYHGLSSIYLNSSNSVTKLRRNGTDTSVVFNSHVDQSHDPVESKSDAPFFLTLVDNEMVWQSVQVGKEYSSWKRKYESYRMNLIRGCLNPKPMPWSASQFEQPLYSNYEFQTVPPTDSGYVIASNFCLRIKDMTFYFYVNGTSSKLPIESLQPANFRNSWKFRSIQGTVPTNSHPWVNSHVFISQPVIKYNIFHFLESVGMVYLMALNCSSFTKMHSLWLPTLIPIREAPWSVGLASSIQNMLEPSIGPDVLFRHDIYSLLNITDSKHPVCFKNAVLLDRIKIIGEGITGHYLLADMYRASVYEYLNVPIAQLTTGNICRVNVLQRDDGRGFLDLDGILALLSSHFGNRVNITHFTPGYLDFRQQVLNYVHSDVIVAPHGSGISGIIFSLPWSVMIECYAPLFFELDYAPLCYVSRVLYISVNDYNNTRVPANDWSKGIAAYQNGTFFEIRRDFILYSIIPPTTQLIHAVEDGILFYRCRRSLYRLSPSISDASFLFH